MNSGVGVSELMVNGSGIVFTVEELGGETGRIGEFALTHIVRQSYAH